MTVYVIRLKDITDVTEIILFFVTCDNEDSVIAGNEATQSLANRLKNCFEEYFVYVNEEGLCGREECHDLTLRNHVRASYQNVERSFFGYGRISYCAAARCDLLTVPGVVFLSVLEANDSYFYEILRRGLEA